MASLYKRGAVWYLKYRDPESGRWVYRSTGVRRREDADKWLSSVESQLDAKAADTGRDLDWDKLLRRYEAWAAMHHADATRDLTRRSVDAFKGLTGCQTIGAVLKSDVQRYKVERGATGQIRSVNSSLTHLRSLVNRAIREGWWDGDNPFSGFEKIRQSTGAPKFLTKPQMDAVLDAAQADGRTADLVFGLGIFAGLRKIEIDRARWDWINWQVGVLHVVEGPGFRIKDAENRHVPLHNRLLAILERYRGESGYIVEPDSPLGRYRYRFDIRKTFARILGAAGLAQRVGEGRAKRWESWVTPHVLRHTFASQLIMGGCSLDKVSIWLGHSDPRTTRIYAHLAPRDEDIHRF